MAGGRVTHQGGSSLVLTVDLVQMRYNAWCENAGTHTVACESRP